MTLIGYTMMCEQAGPKQLLRDVALAEEAGFNFAVISDHSVPLAHRPLECQRRAPFPASLDAASRLVREQDVSAQMPCGPDARPDAAGIGGFEAAGFTNIAPVQVGADTQQRFITCAATELLPNLRTP